VDGNHSRDQATWSTKSALERSTLVFDIRSKHRNCRCTAAISCRREGGQGNVPQDQYWEEGQDRTACSRARSASDGLVLRYEASVPHVFALTRPAGNSLIVGVAYSAVFERCIWGVHLRNYFNEIFKNSYSQKFRPTKYTCKCHTVYKPSRQLLQYLGEHLVLMLQMQ